MRLPAHGTRSHMACRGRTVRRRRHPRGGLGSLRLNSPDRRRNVGSGRPDDRGAKGFRRRSAHGGRTGRRKRRLRRLRLDRSLGCRDMRRHRPRRRHHHRRRLLRLHRANRRTDMRGQRPRRRHHRRRCLRLRRANRRTDMGSRGPDRRAPPLVPAAAQEQSPGLPALGISLEDVPRNAFPPVYALDSAFVEEPTDLNSDLELNGPESTS
jgi:hypothetical protein